MINKAGDKACEFKFQMKLKQFIGTIFNLKIVFVGIDYMCLYIYIYIYG